MSISAHTQEDAILKAMIEEGAPRPTPLNLARTVKYRLKILTAIHRENRHFRIMTGMLIAGMATLVALACLAPYSATLHEWTSRNLPGGMGYYDYLILSFGQTLLATVSALLLVIVIVLLVQHRIAFRNKNGAPKQH